MYTRVTLDFSVCIDDIDTDMDIDIDMDVKPLVLFPRRESSVLAVEIWSYNFLFPNVHPWLVRSC